MWLWNGPNHLFNITKLLTYSFKINSKRIIKKKIKLCFNVLIGLLYFYFKYPKKKNAIICVFKKIVALKVLKALQGYVFGTLIFQKIPLNEISFKQTCSHWINL